MRLLVPLLLIPLALGVPFARSQNAAPVTRDDLPPSAILTDELTTFDRIHSDMANWSDVELAAFQNTTARAKADCNRIEQSPHEGEEALALARLCALGWDWDGTYSAARWYTRRSAPVHEAQHLAMGFAMLLKADLNLRAVARALDELKEMQERVAFSDDTDTIFAYTISALEVMVPDYGVKAALLRQPALLDAVAGKNPSVSPGRAEAEAWHVLSMLHADGKISEEQAQKATLLEAIAIRNTPIEAADQYAAQRARVAYEWLGHELPVPAGRSSYPAVVRRASLPAQATLLVIQEAQAADVPALSLAVDSLRSRLGQEMQARLLLTGSDPHSSAKHEPHAPVVHAIYTPEALLTTLGFEAGPVFVVLDQANRVLWLGNGATTWLNPQQQAEVLLARATSK